MIGFALRGLLRAPGRAIVRVLVLAAASALLGAMILFVGHSLRTMTAGAVRSVPLDWQGPVGSYGAATDLASKVRKQPGVIEAVPVATAPFAGAVHTSAQAGTIRAGAGAILAVPPDYLSHIQTMRFLRGGLKPGEVVLDQQLAATLQAQPGDVVSLLPRPNAKPVQLRVSGIALVAHPDVLFQPLNPTLGPAAAQPPAEIAVVPLDTFAKRFAPELPAISAINPSAAAVPGSPVGVQWQVQAQVDPRVLSGSPTQALSQATSLRNKIERTFPGRIQFVDNLGDQLNRSAGDALYAEALYIMLAVPGALVALGLAYLAALGAVERDRRDLLLLRSRGATRRELLVLAAIESTFIGLVAGLIGAGAALLSLRVLVHGSLGLSAGLVGAAIGICIGLAALGAFVARVGASTAAFRAVGAQSRPRKPLWQKLYLDLIALTVSGLVYWLTARTGFSAVVNPDSNPTLSLSVYMFLAPAFLWIGAALFLVRLRGRALAWAAGRAAGGRATTRREFLLVSAARRGQALNRGLLLVGLLLAFGVEVGVFAATYNQQARVDAELTIGADVVAQAPPGAIEQKGLIQKVSSVPGVAAVSPVDHAYAYVGPDLQDIFGVDANTLSQATTLRDSYFIGGSASAQLARLRQRPDAIIVSKETIKDYSLNLNDLLKLRLLDKQTGQFRIVPFHVSGIVQEFPSAPRDSFMVANLAYLRQVTHDTGPNVLFVKSSGDPASVARSVEAVVRPAGASVKDIRQQSAQTVSSITTVDLSGISKIEEAFAIVLAAATMVLFVSVAVAERRRELAAMAALGAGVREIAAFLWTEAALVVAAGVALAALLGWILAEMLVAMLQHVFDPPPDHLAAPWGYLAALGGAAIVAALVGVLVARRSVTRMPLGAILREE